MTSSDVAQLRCLGSALPAFSTSVAGGVKRQTQWVWRQASERLLFNRNNKIVSKGDEVSKTNRGSGVLVVLLGL